MFGLMVKLLPFWFQDGGQKGERRQKKSTIRKYKIPNIDLNSAIDDPKLPIQVDMDDVYVKV